MKVICKDNFNRDYKPEKLITVSINEIEARVIADALNLLSEENYYEVVDDAYELNLSSMYDVTGEEPPESFYINQYGLKALFNISNKDYYKDHIPGNKGE